MNLYTKHCRQAFESTEVNTAASTLVRKTREFHKCVQALPSPVSPAFDRTALVLRVFFTNIEQWQKTAASGRFWDSVTKFMLFVSSWHAKAKLLLLEKLRRS